MVLQGAGLAATLAADRERPHDQGRIAALLAEVVVATTLARSESVSRPGPGVLALIGLGLILAGVLSVNLFSKSITHQGRVGFGALPLAAL